MQTPIRLGLIGCGGIVQLQHLPTLLDLNEVQIAALADPVTENLAKVASATGVPPDRHYADYRDMLSAGALDAALIATPHHLHAEQVIGAAAAGLAVISEKPMATSLDEARAVLAARAARNVPMGADGPMGQAAAAAATQSRWGELQRGVAQANASAAARGVLTRKVHRSRELRLESGVVPLLLELLRL